MSKALRHSPDQQDVFHATNGTVVTVLPVGGVSAPTASASGHRGGHARTPNRSPHRSPNRSPNRSPHRTPNRTPQGTPPRVRRANEAAGGAGGGPRWNFGDDTGSVAESGGDTASNTVTDGSSTNRMSAADLEGVEELLSTLGALDADGDWLNGNESAPGTPQGSPARPLGRGIFSSPRSGSSVGLLANPTRMHAGARKGSLFEFEQMEAMLQQETTDESAAGGGARGGSGGGDGGGDGDGPPRALHPDQPLALPVTGVRVSRMDRSAPARSSALARGSVNASGAVSQTSAHTHTHTPLQTSISAGDTPAAPSSAAPATVPGGPTGGSPPEANAAAPQGGADATGATPGGDQSVAASANPVKTDGAAATGHGGGSTTTTPPPSGVAAVVADPAVARVGEGAAESGRRSSSPRKAKRSSSKAEIKRPSKQEAKFLESLVDTQGKSRLTSQRTSTDASAVSPTKRATPDVNHENMTFFQMLAFFQKKSGES